MLVAALEDEDDVEEQPGVLADGSQGRRTGRAGERERRSSWGWG